MFRVAVPRDHFHPVWHLIPRPQQKSVTQSSCLNYKQTVEESPSWETNIGFASHDIHRLLWSPEVPELDEPSLHPEIVIV
jgi:hypothetical protein